MLGFLRKKKIKKQVTNLQKDLAESRRRDEEEKQRFEKSITLYNQALRAEEAGRYNQAIKLYLKNIDLYSPQGLSHWERPAIVLEKLKRYDEALKLCDRALKLKVQHGPTAEAFKANFSKRRERLIRKLKERYIPNNMNRV